jgi:hypothetical protein
VKKNKNLILTALAFAALTAMTSGCSRPSGHTPKKAPVSAAESVSASETAKTDSTPAGNPTTKNGVPLEFHGLTYYPNAVEDPEGAVDTRGENGITLHRRELVTSDPSATAAEYYKKKYPSATVLQPDDKNFVFVIRGGGAEKRIAIFPDPIEPGKTAIKFIADTK